MNIIKDDNRWQVVCLASKYSVWTERQDGMSFEWILNQVWKNTDLERVTRRKKNASSDSWLWEPWSLSMRLGNRIWQRNVRGVSKRGLMWKEMLKECNGKDWNGGLWWDKAREEGMGRRAELNGNRSRWPKADALRQQMKWGLKSRKT